MELWEVESLTDGLPSLPFGVNEGLIRFVLQYDLRGLVMVN